MESRGYPCMKMGGMYGVKQAGELLLVLYIKEYILYIYIGLELGGEGEEPNLWPRVCEISGVLEKMSRQ